jgi:hypothetical protein
MALIIRFIPLSRRVGSSVVIAMADGIAVFDKIAESQSVYRSLHLNEKLRQNRARLNFGVGVRFALDVGFELHFDFLFSGHGFAVPLNEDGLSS